MKTGRNELERQQIESYVRLANREGFDAVVTISNEFVAPSAPHPIELTSRVLRQVHLAHWSWAHVLTTAVILRRRQEVSDPEQAWLLDELIRYLEDERSGALFFEGFGPRWVAIRDAARAGTLRAGDEGLEDFAGRWDQFLRHLGLQLSGQLGTEVSIVTKREHKRDPDKRKRDLLAQLAQEYQLDGTLRVPGAAADIQLSANLRARRVRCSVTLQAPASGRATTRINWLVRQLGGAPQEVQVTAGFRGRRSTSEMIGRIREHSKCLLDHSDPQNRPVRFTVALERDMEIKGGRGRGSFVAGIEALSRDFYQDVVQDLKAWVPPAPRMTSDEEPAEEQDADNGGPAVETTEASEQPSDLQPPPAPSVHHWSPGTLEGPHH